MARLLDLDALLPEDMEVKLDGKVYKIPGDLDVATIAKLNALTNKLATGEEVENATRELADNLSEILSLRQEIGPVKLTFAQALTLLQGIIENANETVKKSLPFSRESQSLPTSSTGRTKK